MALAGCSSLDNSVGTNVVSTEVGVARSAPAALATVKATVHLTALSRADHDVAVNYAALEPATGELRLDLAPSPASPFSIHANEDMNVLFVNVGTTNGELASLCGQTMNFYASFTFLDDPRDGAIADGPVVIACP